MGSRQHSELYTALLEFLESHGQLALDGSAERGMPASRASEFISMLEAHQVPIYGLEVWRSTSRGYTVDTPSIWYCVSGKQCRRASWAAASGTGSSRPSGGPIRLDWCLTNHSSRTCPLSGQVGLIQVLGRTPCTVSTR